MSDNKTVSSKNKRFEVEVRPLTPQMMTLAAKALKREGIRYTGTDSDTIDDRVEFNAEVARRVCVHLIDHEDGDKDVLANLDEKKQRAKLIELGYNAFIVNTAAKLRESQNEQNAMEEDEAGNS